MKKFCFVFCLLFVGISVASAQTQRGYVKTRGRLQSNGTTIPGTRLSGATVTLKGNNSVTSGANGGFSFAVSNKSFCIINVRKNGYQIYDHDLLGKTHRYSSNDLLVVMDTPDNVLADKLASERKIRRTLQRQLTEKEDEIEALKEQHKITEEQYQKLLQALYKSQENNEKLISEMAEHYSTIDFDQVNEFQRRVAAFIQNGELMRADSLLNTKGSMEERRAQIEKNRSVLNANAEELKKRQEEQEKGEALQTKTIEDFAADSYSRADICKIRHDNDSAAYWLRMMADIDTLNIEWQLEAGLFIHDYLSDFTTSLHYYHRALAVAMAQEGENGENVAHSYNNIGRVYDAQGDYVQALEMYQKSLKIYLAIFGENHPNVAMSYNNIGSVYDSQGDYVKALEMFQQSLKIILAIFGKTHPDVAQSYNNIGLVYFSQGDYVQALEMCQQSLKINLAIFGETHPDVATSYNNIGSVYDSQGDYVQALEMYQQSLKIRLAIFGENHPDVATSYNNIGGVYSSQGDYVQALEMYQRSLKIRLAIFGETHPDVATSYNNIGSVYYSQGDYIKALEMYQQSLKIILAIFGETHPAVTTIYSNIGVAYFAAIQKGDDVSDFEELIETMAFTATTVGDDTPAAHAGMEGEYVVLEFADWTIESDSSLFDKNEELRGKPKTIVVMKEDAISQYHFENKIGVKFNFKKIGSQEKQRILKAYREWKKNR